MAVPLLLVLIAQLRSLSAAFLTLPQPAQLAQPAQLRGGIVAREAYRPKLIRSVSKTLQKTAGNSLRATERLVELPPLSEARRKEVAALIHDFDRLYPRVALKQHEMRAEYQAHFRPQALSQAWEEMDPMSFAQLFSAELPIEGFVDVGSGLGKLVVMASSMTTVPCWGVELSPARAAAAAEGLKRLPVRRGEVRLVQGNCLRDLPREALERASHFLLTMRRVGKLPAGTRQVAERFLDLLATTPGPTRTVWSVGKRLEPREGLDHVSASFLRAQWSDAEDVLVHRYTL